MEKCTLSQSVRTPNNIHSSFILHCDTCIWGPFCIGIREETLKQVSTKSIPSLTGARTQKANIHAVCKFECFLVFWSFVSRLFRRRMFMLPCLAYSVLFLSTTTMTSSTTTSSSDDDGFPPQEEKTTDLQPK